MVRIVRIAHRGAYGGDIPENSLAAFRQAIDLGATFAECDIQLSKEGTPHVFHDDDLSRLTSATGKVADKSDYELTQITLSNGEPIAKLVLILNIIGGEMMLNIELKNSNSALAVVDAIESSKHPIEKVVFSSWHRGSLFQLKKHYPNVRVGAVVGLDSKHKRKALKMIFDDHVDFISVPKHLMWGWFIKLIKRRGKQVWAYTADTSNDEAQFERRGADAVFTNNY